jgi:hypothetical protein
MLGKGYCKTGAEEGAYPGPGARQTYIGRRTRDPIASNEKREDAVPASGRRATSLARAALARGVSFEGACVLASPSATHTTTPPLRRPSD